MLNGELAQDVNVRDEQMQELQPRPVATVMGTFQEHVRQGDWAQVGTRLGSVRGGDGRRLCMVGVVSAMSDNTRTCPYCGYKYRTLRERDAHDPCPKLVIGRNGLRDPDWRFAR
jgi:hypothetical protein